MEFVTGLYLQVQADDVVKFVDQAHRAMVSQKVAVRGGRVDGLSVRPEENAIYLILIFPAGTAVDMAGIASDLAVSLGLRGASWRQFNPAPPRAEPRFSGVKGMGTQCPVCRWVDGTHAKTCPDYRR